jgi:hypothetical protein
MKNSKKSQVSPKILISTFNLRTLSSDSHLLEFENALKAINYDVIGLCEVKRTGQVTFEQNGNIIHYIGYNNKRGSVGFTIKSKWKESIVQFKDYSDRVTCVELNVNDKDKIAIIQVYAPTSAASESEISSFYDDLQIAINDFKYCKWFIVMGDFNSKIGQRENGEEDVMGPHCYGTRNERGDRMIRFARSNELYISNTIFKKRPNRKWTWRSPDGKTTNEIDFIMMRKNQCSLVNDVSVIGSAFKFSSDHRLLRLNMKLSMKKMISRQPSTKILVNKDQTLKKEFNLKLNANLSITTTSNYYANLESAFKSSSKCFVGGKKNVKIISDETKIEIDEREKLMRIRHLSHHNENEFRDQRKKVHMMIRSDERKFITSEVDDAISNGRSFKHIKNGVFNNKSWIQKLKDKNGIIRHERTTVNEIATDFYESLYKSHMTKQEQAMINPTLEESSQVDEITTEELKYAIDAMKNNKATGNNGIPSDLLKVCDDYGLDYVTKAFNEILKSEKIPESWLESEIILIHKSGPKDETKNYRPITVFPHSEYLGILFKGDRFWEKSEIVSLPSN